MFKKLQVNIPALFLLCLLLVGVVGKINASAYHHYVEKKVSQDSNNNDSSLPKIDITHLSVEAIVPLVSFDIPQFYRQLFFQQTVSALVSFPVIHLKVAVQEKFFKILFQNIMAPNAP